MIKIYDGRESFYQWDLDRKVIVSDTTVTEIHFCNKTGDCSLVVEVVNGIANVPNILLQTSWPIKAYAYCGDRYTKECATFKVIARTKPDDYVYTETEVKRWEDLAREIEDKTSKCEELVGEMEDILSTSEDILDELQMADNHEARITNIEKHINQDYFATDAAVAYEKVVPVNACPYAQVDGVGGMSYKALANNNICIGDGTYTLQNESNFYIDFGVLPQGKYYFSFDNHDAFGYGEAGVEINGNIISHVTDFEFEVSEPSQCYFYMVSEDTMYQNGVYINGTVKNFMLCKADDEDKTYKPYSLILVSAKPTSLESRGANLIPFPYYGGGAGTVKTQNGITFTVREDRGIHIKGKLTEGSAYFGLSKSDFGETSFNAINAEQSTNNAYTISKRLFYNASNKVTSVNVDIKDIDIDEIVYPMVNRGTTLAPYKPYSAEPIDTFALPEAVQSLDGWGLGVNAEYNNHIEWRNGRIIYIQMLDEFDLANVGEWMKAYNYFYTFPHMSPAMKDLGMKIYDRADTPIGVCSHYDVVSTSRLISAGIDKAISYNKSDTQYINIRDTTYTDVASLKEAMNGVKLVYALETPIETDITHLFTGDNIIKVEAGGATIPVNEYNKAAPTSITYLLKEGSI